MLLHGLALSVVMVMMPVVVMVVVVVMFMIVFMVVLMLMLVIVFMFMFMFVTMLMPLLRRHHIKRYVGMPAVHGLFGPAKKTPHLIGFKFTRDFGAGNKIKTDIFKMMGIHY